MAALKRKSANANYTWETCKGPNIHFSSDARTMSLHPIYDDGKISPGIMGYYHCIDCVKKQLKFISHCGGMKKLVLLNKHKQPVLYLQRNSTKGDDLFVVIS